MKHLPSRDELAQNLTLCGRIYSYTDIIKDFQFFEYATNVRCPECYAIYRENETPSKKEARKKIEDALSQARNIVYARSEEQERQYGPPKESFERASVIASILCNKEISAEDIVRVQMALKLSRESFKHKEDNLVDLVAYTSILNDLENEKIND